MDDWELILTMVGEKAQNEIRSHLCTSEIVVSLCATTDITTTKDSQGLEECQESANEGGTIARHTREELEQKLKKSLVSKTNSQHLTKKQLK